MFVKYHVLIGLIASALILLIFPQIGWFYALIIFLSSFLIDFDHYLYYAVKFRDLSLKNAYRWFVKKSMLIRAMTVQERRTCKKGIFIFHGIECWIVLALLIFVHKIFLFVLIGIAIHIVLDIMDYSFWKMPLYAKISQIYTHKRNKNLKEFV